MPTFTRHALQALSVHQESAQEGTAEAHDAVLATLQCIQALTSDNKVYTPITTRHALQALSVHQESAQEGTAEAHDKLVGNPAVHASPHH